MKKHKYFTIHNNRILFPEFFSAWFYEFDSKVEVAINSAVFKGVYDYLYSSLFSISIRALITEMHLMKNGNELIGKTSKQRYDFFEKHTGEERFLKRLYKKYPLLPIYLRMKVDNISKYIIEIVNNFENDKNRLCDLLDVHTLDITDIELGKGDTHNSGKTVAIIVCQKHKIVYKPHNLYPEETMTEILKWVNSLPVSFNLKMPKSINMLSYGWQEFIQYDGEMNDSMLSEYYKKSGAFLALFFLLGTNDIHYENVVINNGNPYFIDLETLFVCRKCYKESVLETGFLPSYTSLGLLDFDSSGLCGKVSVSSKIKTITISNMFTDEMIIQEQLANVPGHKNIPLSNGKPVSIDAYTSFVIEGFRELISFILENKTDFVNLVEGISSAGKFRQVVRATHVYSKFLMAVTHPDYLSDIKKRDDLLRKLFNGKDSAQEKARVGAEIESLCKLDIPYFYVKYNDTRLFSESGIINGYFSNCIREALSYRINNLGYRDIEIQCDTIKKSLFSAYETQIEKNIIVYPESGKQSINQQSIINNIVTEIQNKVVIDNGKLGYLMNSLDNDRFAVTPINPLLYEGGGMLWFLAVYGKKNNDDVILNIGVELLNNAVEVEGIRNPSFYNRLSAFSGIGSLVYLNYNLYKLTDDTQYYEKYKKFIKAIDVQKTVETTESIYYDFVCGLSGLIVMLSHIYLLENDKELYEIIQRHSELLSKFLLHNDVNNIGLAHGITGFAYALFMAYKVTGKKEYLEKVYILLEIEDGIYDSLEENINTSWCNGESGMALIRAKMYVENSGNLPDKLFDKLSKYVDITMTKGIYNMTNMCLCHGTVGNLEILRYISDKTECKPMIEVQLEKIEQDVINSLGNIRLGLKNNMRIENFMNGTAGIAYSIFKEKNGEFPSILLLESMR